MTMSTLAVARRLRGCRPARVGDRKRDSISTRTGKAAIRSRNVLKCCSASTVVGTSTATCLPSMTALNAARIATSVLP